MSPSNVSDQKIEANRLNALKSTGPKSDTGKAKSSQNSRKFGIFCKDLLVPGEDPQDLEVFKMDILRSLNPRNVMELQLVEQIVADEWRIKRVRAAERAAFERLHAEDRQRVVQKNEQRRSDLLAELREYHTMFPTEIRENRVPQHAAEIMADVTARLAQLDTATLPVQHPGVALERLMQSSPEVERLGKYEQRLRNSVHRCLKELRQLRSEEQTDISALTAGMLEDQEQQVIEKNEATDSASDDMATGSDNTAGIPDARHADRPAPRTDTNQPAVPKTSANRPKPGGQ